MTQNSNVPAKIVPTSVPSLKKEGEVKVFTKPQLDFLRAYSQTCDEEVAFVEARIDRRYRNDMLEEPHVQKEMQKIQQVWRFQARLTAGFSAGNHMRLMEKFEDEYDSSDKKEEKARFAGTLAKMSEGTMKATGLIGTTQTNELPTVIINMNGSGDKTANVQVNNGGKNE